MIKKLDVVNEIVKSMPFDTNKREVDEILEKYFEIVLRDLRNNRETFLWDLYKMEISHPVQKPYHIKSLNQKGLLPPKRYIKARKLKKIKEIESSISQDLI